MTASEQGYTVRAWATNRVGRNTYAGYVLMRPEAWAAVQAGEVDSVDVLDVDSGELLKLFDLSEQWDFSQ